MRKTILILSILAMPLAGCMRNDAERAIAGAGVGALAAVALDGNLGDALVAGTAGAAAGALCDDVGVCN